MKNRMALSVIYIITGIVIILTPVVFFPVCSGEMKMACNYTASVEIGVGALIVLSGAVSLLFPSKGVRAGISIGTAALGILTVLLPALLTGVCKSSEMGCHAATYPMLVILGAALTVTAVINAVYLLKKGDRMQDEK